MTMLPLCLTVLLYYVSFEAVLFFLRRDKTILDFRPDLLKTRVDMIHIRFLFKNQVGEFFPVVNKD